MLAPRGNGFSRPFYDDRSIERTIIVFVGLSFEARIAAGPGVCVVCRDDEPGLSRQLAIAIECGCRSIVSFGVAGGLAPDLRPGDWIIGSAIVDAAGSRPTDPTWSRRLLDEVAGAWHAPLLGVDRPICDPHMKRQLHATTGAAAVDMESHIVARLARTHDLALAAIRVVVDPAHRAIPEAAEVAMRPGGRTNVTAIVRSVVTRPSQVPKLLRLVVDAYVARTTLLRLRHQLGPRFGLIDLTTTQGAAELRQRTVWAASASGHRARAT